ncbi:hypothetical protein TSUD_342040 [Trifolium subterraneum]|nr:hypothetical protein TSUD_342040 [Trifolium subterraneum]
MAHSMRRLNRKVGYFAVKVDLAKAYDRLNWNFICNTLIEVGYPKQWIDVVMTAITSVRTNVKWNGVRANFFQPQCDDLILFAEASVDQLNVVLNTLKQVCQMSGQQVSQEKTSIMFSKNVSARLREELASISGFNEATSLGKYLGVPLVGRAPKRSDYSYLINQVKTKLSKWKAKQLSFAGRVTLSKAVIEAIPIYPMMTTAIPKACLQEIQKIQRAFIWGDDDDGRKYHAVNWEIVTKPKAYGGLGIRRLVHMNQACLMKIAWAIRTGKDALWIDVIRGKYNRDGYIQANPSKSLVTDLVDDNGHWKLDLLTPWLPTNIITKLFAVMPPNNSYHDDQRAWIASRGSVVASCGGILRNSNGQWLGGFSKNLGRCNAYLAELWGVYEGLRLAWNYGATKLKLQVDSSVVAYTLNGSNAGSVIGWRLIEEIRRLLALEWEVKVCHSYREANACADALANMGCEHGLGLRMYDQCPPRLSSLLLADVMGITTPRIIAV